MKLLSPLVSIALLLAISPAQGDIIKEISTASTYDGNVFGTSAETSDYITHVSAYASEDLAYLDEDLLVDRYDYGGHEFTAKLTWMTPAGAQVILEGGRETQRYDGQTALDIDELPLATLEDRTDPDRIRRCLPGDPPVAEAEPGL